MRRAARPGRLRPAAGPLLAALALAALASAGCGAERLDVPALVRGHAEVEVRPDGTPVPRALDAGKPLGLCLRVPSALDTSRWEARLSFGGEPSPAGFAPPVARMGETVCFEGTLPPRARGRLRLCGQLVDRFDGSRRDLPCAEVRAGGGGEAHAALDRDLRALLGEQQSGQPLGAFLTRLDGLAARARAAELPLLDVRFALVAVHFLTREATPAALAEAARRLDRLPAWLDREAVSRQGAQAAYARGELEVARARLAPAWQAFAEAERRYARIADPERFTVTIQQADLLSQAGAPREAVERLRAGLDDCRRLRCDPWLLPYGRLQLGWLVLLEPDAGRAELEEAERSLTSGLRDIEEDADPAERANHLLNLGYLQVRLGRDPSTPLARARRILSSLESGGAGRSALLGWADLVEGLAALRDGEVARALALCSGRPAAGDPALSARALSCTAEARRQQGDLAGADLALTRALALHELGSAERLGLRIPLGPGQRADDYAQAARVAVERGEANRGWELLAGLDRVSAHEGERRQCRESADAESQSRWGAIDTVSAALQKELAALDRPASGARQKELEIVRRDLQERLRALWREWPGCPQAAGAAAAGGDEGVRFRAVALEDEVLLLGRDATGRVRVERRTRLSRDHVGQMVARIGRALDRRDLDDEAWRRLAAPIAAALLPRDPGALEEVTPFALHGLLQGVPLAALPLPAADGGPRWLGEATTVAFQPAGARPREIPHGSPGEPLLVIDPLGDLPGGSELLPLYRELFPGSRILHRGEARSEAFRRALPGAAWLHLDTHGAFDPAFPELSSLALADGPLRLVQLAGLPVTGRFANLSGCETGRWPFTADSGRFGMGGLLARLGVPWVIASRTSLDDRLARDFNTAFYRAIRSGRSVPAAHGEAMAAVRLRHPAVSWAGLLLLRGAGGQNDHVPTPAK